MRLYKLTDRNLCTYDNYQWEIGVRAKLKRCKSPQLCSGNVFHAYKSISLALLLNPIHANIKPPTILECDGKIQVEDWGKVGCFTLKPTKIIDFPSWYLSEKIRRMVTIGFSVLCTRNVLHNYESVYPEDHRPRKAIEAAEEFLNLPQTASAAWSAASAARAAWSAASAASAANAARAAGSAARAAGSAASAAGSAAESAWNAASAAWSAARAAGSGESAAGSGESAACTDFNKIANKAVEMYGEKT